MEDSGIVEQIAAADGAKLRELLWQAEACGPKLTDTWLAVLERTRNAPDDVRLHDWTHVWALYFLAEYRDGRALPAVLDLLALPEETLDLLWGDILTEHMDRVLASLSHGDDASSRALIEREDVFDYARAAALGGLEISCVQGELPRERLVGYLRELLGGRLPREPNALWEEAAMLVLDLGIVELRKPILTALDEGLIFHNLFAPEDLEFPESGAAPPPERLARLTFIEGAADAVRPWLPLPPSPSGKIGRNGPSPCGSGLKYDHCCLPLTETGNRER